MASNTVSAFSTAVATIIGNIIIGPTPPSIYDRLIKQDALIVDRSAGLEVIRSHDPTGDGQVTIVKSKATGACFARKLTPRTRLDSHNTSSWDYGPYKKPNEVHVLEVSRLKDHPHPRILSFEALRHDRQGEFVIWSSFCAGGNLAEQIDFWRQRRRTEVPHQFFLHILVQAFEAIAFLHNGLRYAGSGKYYRDGNHKTIVHGDLKGENIFLRWSSENVGAMPDIVVGDFGTSIVEGHPGARVMAGTLPYNAPEIKAIYGDNPIDEDHVDLYFEAGAAKTPPADIYAIGVLLYMIAAKARKDRDPFPANQDLSELRISRDYEIEGLKDFIVKCLQVDPSKRATADYDEQTGIMTAVDTFRDMRDLLITKNPALGPTDWLHPQPVR
ncbi:putative serine/threonine-protein kinase fhkD [Pseudocercospora fuligena]|uniref:non-specific serine/threonine protein kinase n=1 Tax=Pseudocercospora fuligena TaxID=685502 RepID=A0A8H6RCA5_9PEZI|nr:putative serine/threonine-protein kinase fhkD [Pseudocercospora fuligena]